MFTVFITGGENDGKVLAEFESEYVASKYAKVVYESMKDELDLVCGGIGIVNNQNEPVEY